MKVAALDLGTNTFLCLIAEVEGSRITRIYEDQVRVVRLGQDVNRTRLFHPDAIARARVALAEFAELIKSENPQKVLAMATSAARDVENSEELFQIGKELNIPIQIIPGSREAEITYRGSVSGYSDQKRRLVVDIGGGSTEMIIGMGQRYDAGQSVNLGGVRLTEKFNLQSPISHEKMTEVSLYIREHLSHIVKTLMGFAGGLDEVLAVAGTPTELARIEIGEFIPEKIDGFILSKQKLAEWIEIFRVTPAQEIATRYSVHPGRADVILVGTLLLYEVLVATGFSQMTVSTRGVRYGIALELGGL